MPFAADRWLLKENTDAHKEKGVTVFVHCRLQLNH